MNSRRRVWLLLPLALLHVLLLGWLAHQHARPGAALPAALTVVRLLAERRPPAPPPQRQVPARIEARAPLPVIAPIAPPSFDIAPPATITASPAAAQGAAATARPAPLNLALPATPPASSPERWRNPALSDPRANTPRADYGARMADTLGTDTTLREQALGGGSVRFRQGTNCVEVSQSRIAQIDPMGESMRGSPRLVTTCKK